MGKTYNIDVFSRKILGYQISNVVDSELCVNAIEELQLTVSIDGKWRWADNAYIERFWRTIKHETARLERFKHINDEKTYTTVCLFL